jgi:hypothetical protein
MSRKLTSMGSNTHSGINIDSIKNMGDAQLYNCIAEDAKVMGETRCESCTFDKLSCMGEAYVKDSSIKNAKFMGDTTFENSSFESVSVVGMLSVKEGSKADSLKIMGNINAKSLYAKILSVGSKDGSFLGIFNFGGLFGSVNKVSLKGDISGETLESVLQLESNGILDFKNLIFKNSFKAINDIECEQFYSLGEIDAQGINSEYTFIRPCPNSKINTITGSKLMICRDFSLTNEFINIPKNYSDSLYEEYDNKVGVLEIGLIEADDIYVENVNVDYIRGKNIVIGSNCHIKQLEYTNEIEISKNSIVAKGVKI